jgi:hypothetical protein
LLIKLSEILTTKYPSNIGIILLFFCLIIFLSVRHGYRYVWIWTLFWTLDINIMKNIGSEYIL